MGTLCNVVQAAGMVDAFSGGTWTVFAPTDDAFAEIPSSSLLPLLADAEALKDLLMYHSLSGEALSASELPCVPGDNLIEMANGKLTRTLCDGDTPQYQKGKGNTVDNLPEIIIVDIEACNGIIHLVDGLILL